MHDAYFSSLYVYDSTPSPKSQYPMYHKMAQQSHILCIKYPYFEPFYGISPYFSYIMAIYMI